jgi:site-specific DNA-methyltransferase (adenine-specific)
MAVRIEDAGFEIRDMIAWVYGSGFPKSLNVSKAIDKAAGAVGEIIAERRFGKTSTGQASGWNDNAVAATGRQDVRAPATDAARQWQGWGTALKPALEPITVARKPLGEKTVAANVLEHGTGAINVDGCRVGTETIKTQGGNKFPGVYGTYATCQESTHQGRWPANLIHDGSDEVVGLFPQSKDGVAVKRNGVTSNGVTGWGKAPVGTPDIGYGGGGSAARFFYCAKASKRDRDKGLEGFEASAVLIGAAGHKINPTTGKTVVDIPRKNNHPTVKPTDLMRYLCRLVTPPDGIVLDPFMGSGSTGKAAALEGFSFIGIEREAEYVEIAKARIDAARVLL